MPERAWRRGRLRVRPVPGRIELMAPDLSVGAHRAVEPSAGED